ncbi:MAG: hypothetical protein ACOYL3_15740 [Desulfuromonadaceae bacterium]
MSESSNMVEPAIPGVSRNVADGPRHMPVTIDRGAWLEHYWGGTVRVHECTKGYLSAWVDRLYKGNNAALHLRIYGRLCFGMDIEALFGPRVQIDFINAPGGTCAGWLGIQVFAVEAKEGTRLSLIPVSGGRQAWTLESATARMGYVPYVASREHDFRVACRATINSGFDCLQRQGFQPSDLVRTWFYFQDVLRDYVVFNEVRKEIFIDQQLTRLPASTGIQGGSVTGELVTMGLLAFSGLNLVCSAVSNPVQCEASSYGPMFSRAILTEGAGPRQLIVSGMAAIDVAGRTTHVGDPLAQVDDTLARAAQLLEANHLSWSQVVAGVVYLSPTCYAEILVYLESTVVVLLPVAYSIADVCRPDLLFEIEFTAFG